MNQQNTLIGRSNFFITLSVVSHRQGEMVGILLDDIVKLNIQGLRVVVTINVPEDLTWHPEQYTFPIDILFNKQPYGFGENHNIAFKQCITPYFCVINPDIRLETNPFPTLLTCIDTSNVGIVAPAVLNTVGALEDSVRRFPTFFGLLVKALKINNGGYSIELGGKSLVVDWVGGMFILFRSTCFSAVNGFDENFFLYYEDVDICARFWKAGYKVAACPKAVVIHDARRTSHKNLRYLTWHLSSMGRYFYKHLYRLPATK